MDVLNISQLSMDTTSQIPAGSNSMADQCLSHTLLQKTRGSYFESILLSFYKWISNLILEDKKFVLRPF